MANTNKGAIPKAKKPVPRWSKTPRTPPPKPDESEYYQCEKCLIRTDEEIVQCDVCQLWYHFSCANVTSEIKDFQWACPQCRGLEPTVEFGQHEQNPSGYQQVPILPEMMNPQLASNEPPPQVTNRNESICEMCMTADDQPVVKCIDCSLWYHFNCVNVPMEAVIYDWLCPNCTIQTPVVNISKITESNLEQNPNFAFQPESAIPTGLNQDDGNQRNSTLLNMDKKSSKSSRYSKTKSGISSSSRRRLLELRKLEEERRIELEERERRAKSDKEYVDKKYSILEQGESSEGDLSYDDEEKMFQSIFKR